VPLFHLACPPFLRPGRSCRRRRRRSRRADCEHWLRLRLRRYGFTLTIGLVRCLRSVRHQSREPVPATQPATANEFQRPSEVGAPAWESPVVTLGDRGRCLCSTRTEFLRLLRPRSGWLVRRGRQGVGCVGLASAESAGALLYGASGRRLLHALEPGNKSGQLGVPSFDCMQIRVAGMTMMKSHTSKYILKCRRKRKC
jgi:hypothetical protein